MAKETPSKYKDAQLEEMDRKRREALAEELQKIREKSPIKQQTKDAVELSLRDKIVSNQESFQTKGSKGAGFSAGYVATEKATGETFILKQFYKNESDCVTEQDKTNRMDGVQEFIGSTMYQFLLYDRAPKEQLVTPDKENSKSLYVRSKFFKDVEQLSVFSGGNTGGALGYDTPKIKNLTTIKGFEKVVAACHILGEMDYHAGNMMVQKDGTINKIDHGKSFLEFNKDFATLIKSTYGTLNACGYLNEIQDGNLNFDIEKYSTSLNQMVSQLSENQIDAIIDQRIAELKKAGFNPAGLVSEPQFSSQDGRKNIPINDFDDLNRVYKDITKENLRNMQEIAKQVEIVAKFSNISKEFKKGGWLEEFAESQEKDPVQYAIKNNIKIDGIDPNQYALKMVIDEYLKANETDKPKLQTQYQELLEKLEKERPLDKDEKSVKQHVLEKLIDQYLSTESPAAQKDLKEKYAAIQKLGEKEAPKLLNMESNLGQFLNNPKAAEIIANHKDLKGKSADIDYTKCDLDVIKKCKELHEKTSKVRDYDKLSNAQKVGLAFATVIPIIGNAVAYYAMKSHNKSEKTKLETEIGQSLDGIKTDLDKLSKTLKQHEPKSELDSSLTKIRKSVSHHKASSSSAPTINTKKTTVSFGRSG